MSRRKIRIKNIESLLSHKIEKVYQNQLEHQLDSISYKLLDRILIITLQGTITTPEKLLQDSNRYYLAERVREAIDNVIHPQIQDIIEEVLDVKVVDFLSDTTIKNDITGAIAILKLE